MEIYIICRKNERVVCIKTFQKKLGITTVRLKVIFLVSLNQPAAICGLLLSGFVSEKIGRRKSLMMFNFAQILVSFLVFSSHTFLTLLASLISSGIFNYTVMIPSFALLSEICLIRSFNYFSGKPFQ